MNKEQLENIALVQRIGEITSHYERDMASLRADVTLELEKFQQRVTELENENMELRASLGDADVVQAKNV